MSNENAYDAVLLLSFGGPEGPDDVVPFLENVTRGRPVPRERLLAVAEHYAHFGGVSPINAQNRELLAALTEELRGHGHQLPVYWGNRHWRPLLPDVVRQMAADGVRRALAFVTSAFSSYSGCRQYLDAIEQARAFVGPTAPRIDKLRAFFNHPGFILPMAERVRQAFDSLPPAERDGAPLVFTAHSIPTAMARGCAYEAQLHEACRLTAAEAGRSDWRLAYQSRSGPPSQPWLEPDVCDCLERLGAGGDCRSVVVAPIGFLSAHVEVLYDLDIEARAACDRAGLHMVRADVVGPHPRFVAMIRELIEERLADCPQRLAMGTMGPSHDVCPADCCRPQ